MLIFTQPQIYIEIFWYARLNAILWAPRGESYTVFVIKKLKIPQGENYVQANKCKKCQRNYNKCLFRRDKINNLQ